jgi:hypothetical protein
MLAFVDTICVPISSWQVGERGGADGAPGSTSSAAEDAANAAVSHHSQARAVLEAAVTSSMSHPNVVATLHVGSFGTLSTRSFDLWHCWQATVIWPRRLTINS